MRKQIRDSFFLILSSQGVFWGVFLEWKQNPFQLKVFLFRVGRPNNKPEEMLNKRKNVLGLPCRDTKLLFVI